MPDWKSLGASPCRIGLTRGGAECYEYRNPSPRGAFPSGGRKLFGRRPVAPSQTKKPRKRIPFRMNSLRGFQVPHFGLPADPFNNFRKSDPAGFCQHFRPKKYRYRSTVSTLFCNSSRSFIMGASQSLARFTVRMANQKAPIPRMIITIYPVTSAGLPKAATRIASVAWVMGNSWIKL